MTARRVLFLCTGNSCRSQMAEAIVNDRHPEWRAFSAGNRPTGVVHPLTLRVLREIGIDHKGESKSVEKYRHVEFDPVITLCGEAKEDCPLWLGTGIRLHEDFMDPVRVDGTEEQRLRAFRQVRDDLLTILPELLS